MSEEQLKRDLEKIEKHFKETPDIIISIGMEECGLISNFSKNGLLKTLNERNKFIRKIAEIVPKEKMDEIYTEILKDIKFTEEDYTRESKRIDCETPCEHLDMGEYMGSISFCNKYLRGEEDKCPNRTYLR